MFEKSAAKFPSKNNYIFLSHCAVSPIFGPAAEKEAAFLLTHAKSAGLTVSNYGRVIEGLHRSFASLLKVGGENISITKNTAEGLSMIANGYPFQPGDEVISYVHEYPANHYPWKIQERRGVNLKLLPDRDCGCEIADGYPRGWLMEDLERLVSSRTRIVALSHVQFASGYAADLKELGEFCRKRNIDLVIDAAQSLGCLPLYPDEFHISAVASSGWKWLMGPLGTGVLFTTPAFRKKIAPIMVGAEMMTQGSDYLNHSWQPFSDGRQFEYSTSPLSPGVGMLCVLEELFSGVKMEEIRDECFRLQDLFIDNLGVGVCKRAEFKIANRSGICSVLPDRDPQKIAASLSKENIIVTVRGGYLRIAPHFCNDDNEVVKAAKVLRSVLQ